MMRGQMDNPTARSYWRGTLAFAGGAGGFTIALYNYKDLAFGVPGLIHIVVGIIAGYLFGALSGKLIFRD